MTASLKFSFITTVNRDLLRVSSLVIGIPSDRRSLLIALRKDGDLDAAVAGFAGRRSVANHRMIRPVTNDKDLLEPKAIYSINHCR